MALVSLPLDVTTGQTIDWEAAFTTTVDANGYARVDARLDNYRVEVIRDYYNIVKTISSFSGPVGGSEGWGLYMGMVIIISNFWGFVTGEWRGVRGKPVQLMGFGIVLLLIAISLIGYGTTL